MPEPAGEANFPVDISFLSDGVGDTPGAGEWMALPLIPNIARKLSFKPQLIWMNNPVLNQTHPMHLDRSICLSSSQM